MTTINEIVNFDVASIEDLPMGRTKFLLSDGTIVVAHIEQIKTPEDQQAELETAVAVKQAELTQLSDQLSEVRELVAQRSQIATDISEVSETDARGPTDTISPDAQPTDAPAPDAGATEATETATSDLV
jgi:hypothetical protein